MTRRYEFKYTITGLGIQSILDAVRFHFGGFSEAYPSRRVNNYYLDTANLDYFYQNIDGISRRRKFRYRWYGDIKSATKGQLEVKHKENELGWKEIFDIEMTQLATPELLAKHFSSLDLSLLPLRATLYNSYLRHYFISADQKFRITVDYQQEFGLPFHFGQAYQSLYKNPDIILELKFDEAHFDAARTITTHLPFLRTKNSKYSTGICALYQD